MPVPFLGRLNILEYVALVGSFLLVGLESIIRVLTLALPTSLLSLFYRASRRVFNRLTSPEEKRAEQRRKSISTSIRDASDFVDLCAMFGYTAEEHVVQTEDGYLLGLHRLAWRKGEEDTKVNNGPKSTKKRVVYLHHGLLMNSEVWVCLTDAQRALPFVLVDRGFDVWFGNNRGNKYSKKSVHCRPTSVEFWNFSMDEFAFHDIPDSIRYVLETTGQQSLSYIGFSQGTAQAFASLAVHPKLNNQVNVFIALAPAMSPAGLHNGIVDALVKASPQVLFLLFGRRSILSSATMWQSILYPPLFAKVIDFGLAFLFNWQTRCISTSQKLAAYPHLYSFTSTKSVVHWFQIIRTKSFQMYDDDVHPPLSLSTSSKYTKVAKYPTRNIKTPVVLIYGGSDSLVDIRVMLRELPRQTVAIEVPHYEHLDFLWARDVDARVFPHVFDALESFTGAEHTKEEYERYRSARHESLSATAAFRRHEPRGSDVLDSDVSTALGGSEREAEAEAEAEQEPDDDLHEPEVTTPTPRSAKLATATATGAIAARYPSHQHHNHNHNHNYHQNHHNLHNHYQSHESQLERLRANNRSSSSGLLFSDDESPAYSNLSSPVPVPVTASTTTPTTAGRFANVNVNVNENGHDIDIVSDSRPEDIVEETPLDSVAAMLLSDRRDSYDENTANANALPPASPASMSSSVIMTLPPPPAESPSSALKQRRRPSTGGSSLSLESLGKGARGISLGTSRAVGGVTTSGAEAGLTGSASGSASPGEEGRGSLRRKGSGR